MALGLDLFLTLGQAAGLLAYFIEGDLGIVGLHIGIRAINGDHGGLGDLGFQRGRYGIIRVKRDITRLQHVLDGGHVGFFAKYYARIAINLHRNERGVLVGAVDCATSGRTGCGRIGGGERSDGGNRLHIISMVETARHQSRRAEQTCRGHHSRDLHPLALVQRPEHTGRLGMSRHCAP